MQGDRGGREERGGRGGRRGCDKLRESGLGFLGL